jgi:hypothetical protein
MHGTLLHPAAVMLVCAAVVVGLGCFAGWTYLSATPLPGTVPGCASDPVKSARFRDQFSSVDEWRESIADYYFQRHCPTLPSDVVCHNASGSCDEASKTFGCIDATRVPYADRCDGIADCPDGGSDELLCDLDPAPMSFSPTTSASRRSESARRTFEELMTCTGCACSIGGLVEVSSNNPWYDMALATRQVPELILAFPPGGGCDSHATVTVLVQLYKKTGFCRKAVCCVRQAQCVRCKFDNVTAIPGKCRVFVKNVTAGAM